MIPVLETSSGVFERASPVAIVERLDGEARAPLQTLLSGGWTDAERAEYGLFLVEPQEAPAGHVVIERSYQRVDGAVREVLTTEPAPAPAAVTPRQMRLALLQLGLMAQVDAYVATLPAAAIIEWEYATAVERTSPLIAAAAAGLEMTDAEVDGLFSLAASL